MDRKHIATLLVVGFLLLIISTLSACAAVVPQDGTFPDSSGRLNTIVTVLAILGLVGAIILIIVGMIIVTNRRSNEPGSTKTAVAPVHAKRKRSKRSRTAVSPQKDARTLKHQIDTPIPPPISISDSADNPDHEHNSGVVISAPVEQRQQPGRDDEIPKPPVKKSYYLTANTNQFILASGESKSLQVEAWEAEAGKKPVPCSASLSITYPPVHGMTVDPSTGNSKLDSKVSAARDAHGSTFPLHVQGTAPDGQIMQAVINVTVAANQYELNHTPHSAEMRPGETREFEISLLRYLYQGGQEIATDIPINLEIFSDDNPLKVEPSSGRGHFKFHVSIPPESIPKQYYIQAKASPPDRTDIIKVLIGVRVLPPSSMVVAFNKPLWEPNWRTDLYDQPDIDPQALDLIAKEGGRMLVRFTGELRGAQETIHSLLPIEHGECILGYEGKTIKGVWDPAQSAYLVEIPSQVEHGSGEHQLTVSIRVPLPQAQVRVLNRLLADTTRIGNALEQPLAEDGRNYVREYLAVLSRSEGQNLADRKRDLLTWVFNTGTFTRYTAESVDAFKLALRLHESAYRRFFNNMISYFLEILSLLIDKIAGQVWQTFVNRGKQIVQETIGSETKQAIEEMLAAELHTLVQHGEMLKTELIAGSRGHSESRYVKAAREAALGRAEAEIRQIEKQLTDEQTHLKNQRRALEDAEDEAAEQIFLKDIEAVQQRIRQLEEQIAEHAINRQNITATLDALETEISRQIQEMQKLAGQVQGNKSQVYTLEQVQRGVRKARDLNEIAGAISNARTGLESLDPEAKQALDSFIDRHIQQIDEIITYLENNKANLREADALVARLHHLQTSLRHQLDIDTIKSNPTDFVVKPELKRRIKEINDALNQVMLTSPDPDYRTMKREDYEVGMLGSTFYQVEGNLEWLYPFHEWVRGWFPPLVWAEDAAVGLFEGFLEKQVRLCNLMIEFPDKREAVRSVIEPGLRKSGMTTGQANGLSGNFFHFTTDSLLALGRDLNPRQLTNNWDGKTSASQSLKSFVETRFRDERRRQQADAHTYFASTLRNALSRGFGRDTHAADLSVSTSMTKHLQSIILSMQGYVKEFNAAEITSGNMLPTLNARLWEAGEWTAREVETQVDWDIWATQSLASLVKLLDLPTGIGAPASPNQLRSPTLMELLGEPLRAAIVSLWSLPGIIGFQYDVMVAHALLYNSLFSGVPESLDNLIVDRYNAGIL